MRVEFAHKPEDFIEASTSKNPKWTQPKGEGGQVQMDPQSLRAVRRAGLTTALLVVGLVLMLPSCIYLSMRHSPLWLIPSLFIILFVGVVARSFISRTTRWGWQRRFASDERNADPIAVEIDESGFQFFASAWECHIEWRAVRHFFPTKSLLLLVDDAPSTFVIPKRAFSSVDMQQQFCQFVNDQLVTARSTRREA
jgi:hypothetical protein